MQPQGIVRMSRFGRVYMQKHRAQHRRRYLLPPFRTLGFGVEGLGHNYKDGLLCLAFFLIVFGPAFFFLGGGGVRA